MDNKGYRILVILKFWMASSVWIALDLFRNLDEIILSLNSDSRAERMNHIHVSNLYTFPLKSSLPFFLVMIVLFNISVMIYSRVCVSYGKLEDCICLGPEAAGELTLGLRDSLKCTYFS